jgi:hypothetical protein
MPEMPEKIIPFFGYFPLEQQLWQWRLLNRVILIFLEVYILDTGRVMGRNFFIISQRK